MEYQLKKPVEAIQYTGNNHLEVFEFCTKHELTLHKFDDNSFLVEDISINDGDFILAEEFHMPLILHDGEIVPVGEAGL
jgi:hypothetical protein